MPKKFVQAFDGDRIAPQMKGYKLCCCDCGAVHDIDFEVVLEGDTRPNGDWMTIQINNPSLRVVFTPVKNNRSTALKRRWKRMNGWRGIK